MDKIILNTNTVNKERVKDYFADAFFNDAFYVHIVPNEAVRKQKIKSIFDMVFNIGLNYGSVYTDSDNNGAAIWIKPGASVGIIQALQCGIGSLVLNMGVSSSLRFKDLSDEIEHARVSLAPANHWYLLLFGVDPLCHGKGIGSRMMDANLEELGANGVPFYLETFNKNNVGYYKRWGFELIEERKTKSGPVFWSMVRK
jgi:ribosomal protein S18 acetylase RimI-like enzyme